MRTVGMSYILLMLCSSYAEQRKNSYLTLRFEKSEMRHKRLPATIMRQGFSFAFLIAIDYTSSRRAVPRSVGSVGFADLCGPKILLPDARNPVLCSSVAASMRTPREKPRSILLEMDGIPGRATDRVSNCGSPETSDRTASGFLRGESCR